MEKSKILKFFEINDEIYQKTCAAIELKNPSELSEAEIKSFEKVQGWMSTKECSSYKEASDRFKAEKASQPSDISDTVTSVLEVSRPQIEAEVVRIHGRTPEILAELENQYVAGIYAIAGNVLLRESQKMRDASVFAVIDAEKSAAALPAAKKGGDS
jgi:hypothetical protein